MAKKIITIGPKGLRERVEGSGPVDAYSFDNLQVNSPYTVGELPEDRFDTIQAAIDQWDADGQPPFPILVRQKRLSRNFAFPWTDESAYVENITVPLQKAFDPDGTFGTPEDTVLLTIKGIGNYEYNPRERQFSFNSNNIVFLHGNITLKGSSVDGTLSSNLRLENFYVRPQSDFDNTLKIETEDSNDFVWHTIMLKGSYIIGDINQGNSKAYIYLENSEFSGGFSEKTGSLDISSTNTIIKAENSLISSLVLKGDARIPRVDIRNSYLNTVHIEGNATSTDSDQFVFESCRFGGLFGPARIDDGESAIRITSNTNWVKIVNCIMNFERQGSGDCNILDLNTDVYLDAAISVDSLGTGSFAISSDGNAYELHANVRAMLPNGIPTTTTDGNVTVVSASVNLT